MSDDPPLPLALWGVHPSWPKIPSLPTDANYRPRDAAIIVGGRVPSRRHRSRSDVASTPSSVFAVNAMSRPFQGSRNARPTWPRLVRGPSARTISARNAGPLHARRRTPSREDHVEHLRPSVSLPLDQGRRCDPVQRSRSRAILRRARRVEPASVRGRRLLRLVRFRRALRSAC
jgi:hypothetical protein